MRTDDRIESNRKVARRQRLLAVAILAALCVFAGTAVYLTDKPHHRRVPGDNATFSIRPEGADREALIARYDARFLAMSREIDGVRKEARDRETQLRSTVAQQQKTISDQAKTLMDLRSLAARAGLLPKPGETPEETAKRISSLIRAKDDADYIKNVSEQFGTKTPGETYTVWPEYQSGAKLPDTSGRTVPDADQTGVPQRRLAVVTLSRDTKTAGGRRGTASQSKPETPRIGPAPTLKPDVPLNRNRALGTTVEDYLPAGSFLRGRLLTGVYAATGNGAASQPLPMLIRVEDLAILPNAWKSNVTSCHLTASASGDLSSERVFVRLDRLSCVGKKGEALDVRVTGYAVGEDGKVGVRGRLVTRSGQAIASALSVGMLSGLGTAISRSNEEVTTSITGTQSRRYRNAWASGLGDGLTDAMDRITDYYLKLADRIFPVLEVDAGRPVDIVISQGVLLADRAKTR